MFRALKKSLNYKNNYERKNFCLLVIVLTQQNLQIKANFTIEMVHIIKRRVVFLLVRELIYNIQELHPHNLFKRNQ